MKKCFSLKNGRACPKNKKNDCHIETLVVFLNFSDSTPQDLLFRHPYEKLCSNLYPNNLYKYICTCSKIAKHDSIGIEHRDYFENGCF